MRVLLIIAAVMMAASALPMDTFQRMLKGREKQYIKPTSDDLEVDTQSAGNVMDIPPLNIGQTINVVYINPTVGRVSIYLHTESGDVALLVNPRHVAGGTGSHLLLNTKLNGKWQKAVTYPGFPFPANGVSTRVLVSITVQENGFLIAANGIEITEFSYRPSLGYETVSSISWGTQHESGEQKAVLEAVGLYY